MLEIYPDAERVLCIQSVIVAVLKQNGVQMLSKGSPASQLVLYQIVNLLVHAKNESNINLYLWILLTLAPAGH